jgi:hypothetical protein
VTEWRKHDPHFLQNAKIVRAAMRAGAVAPLLALTLLDLNAIGDRRGTLGHAESQLDYLLLRLISSGLRDTTEEAVGEAIDALREVGFLGVDESGRITLPGWSDDEFGIRGRGPKPKDLRACAHCGESFQPQRKDHRFCSAACRKADYDSRNRTPSDAPTDASDGRSDGRNGEKEGRIDGETEYPPTPQQASVRSEGSAPKGDSCAEEPDPCEVASMADQVRAAGVKSNTFRVRDACTAFCRDGGTPDDLGHLIGLASRTANPGAVLWKWIGDAYEWRSVLDDQAASKRHHQALAKSRQAANEAQFREANGLDGEGGPKLAASNEGAA